MTFTSALRLVSIGIISLFAAGPSASCTRQQAATDEMQGNHDLFNLTSPSAPINGSTIVAQTGSSTSAGNSTPVYHVVTQVGSVDPCISSSVKLIEADGTTKSFPSIQEAVSKSNPGATVLVPGQVPAESINIESKTDMTLKTLCSAQVLRVDLSSNTNVQISGFKIVPDHKTDGSGIQLHGGKGRSNKSILLQSLLVSDAKGDGIHVEEGNQDITIDSNTVVGNSGNGLRIENSHDATFSVTRNTVNSNGLNGIWLDVSGSVNLSSNTVLYNGSKVADTDAGDKYDGNGNGYGIRFEGGDHTGLQHQLLLKGNLIAANHGRSVPNESSMDLGDFDDARNASASGNLTSVGSEPISSQPALTSTCNVTGILVLHIAGSPEFFSSVRDALARVVSGDEVIIGAGTYNDVISLAHKANITFHGRCAERTIVGGIRITNSSEVTIRNVTIDGGLDTDFASKTVSRAATASHAKNLTSLSPIAPVPGITIGSTGATDSDITISNVSIKDTTGPGITILQGSNNISINHSIIAGGKSFGILAQIGAGDFVGVNGNEIRTNLSSGIALGAFGHYALTNNYIHDNGQDASSASRWGLEINPSFNESPLAVGLVNNRIVNNNGASEDGISSIDIAHYNRVLDDYDRGNITTNNNEGEGIGDNTPADLPLVGASPIGNHSVASVQPGMKQIDGGTLSYIVSADVNDPSATTTGTVFSADLASIYYPPGSLPTWNCPDFVEPFSMLREPYESSARSSLG